MNFLPAELKLIQVGPIYLKKGYFLQYCNLVKPTRHQHRTEVASILGPCAFIVSLQPFWAFMNPEKKHSEL